MSANNPPKIIVIDDEECIRDSFKWFLEDKGYQVITAACPTNCPVYHGDHCNQEQACGDLVLVDFNMPKMTGLEFIEQMAQNGCKAGPEKKFIMSGNPDAIDKQRAQAIGCTILQKPVALAQLEQIVRMATKPDKE